MTSTLALRPLDRTQRARLARRVGDLARRVETLAHRAVLGAALGLIGLGVIGFSAQWRSARDPVGGAAAPAARVAVAAPEAPWRDIELAGPTLKLGDRRFGGAASAFSARERGGDREDVLTLGAFDGDRPFAAFDAAQLEKPGADSGFYVAMARRAARLGLSVTRADLPLLRDSRLGPIETAALTLTGARGARENCRGFRLRGAPQTALSGLICLSRDENFTERDLLCLLDDLTGAEGAAKALLAAAAARPASCSTPVVARDPVVAPPPHGKRAQRVAGKPRPR